MPQPGRKPGINISAEVEKHLKRKSLFWHSAADMLEAWPFAVPLTEDQLRNALSHLVGKGRVQRSGRGKDAKWKYKSTKKASRPKAKGSIEQQVDDFINTSNSTDLPQVALDVQAAQVVDEPLLLDVPNDEPVAEFQILGRMERDGQVQGVVVRPLSPGWSRRAHLITEL